MFIYIDRGVNFMKKRFLLIICVLMCFSVFAQTDWGESIDWKKGFYIYAAGTNLELNENQEIFLIYNYFYDDWKQFHNDEFEWKDRKAQNLRIINEEIESNKNYISGNDLLTALPEMRNLIYHASLKYPLKSVNIFSRLVNLKSLHLYGDLAKDIELNFGYDLKSMVTIGGFGSAKDAVEAWLDEACESINDLIISKCG